MKNLLMSLLLVGLVAGPVGTIGAQGSPKPAASRKACLKDAWKGRRTSMQACKKEKGKARKTCRANAQKAYKSARKSCPKK